MNNEDDSDNPSTPSQEKPLGQTPYAESAPQQTKVRTKCEDSSNDYESETTKLREHQAQRQVFHCAPLASMNFFWHSGL